MIHNKKYEAPDMEKVIYITEDTLDTLAASQDNKEENDINNIWIP